ncbi:MAG: VanZ family protein [Lachnospiraceae bacterium]|nr:VanZ family protein [Lachnospiraceae bacterium]
MKKNIGKTVIWIAFAIYMTALIYATIITDSRSALGGLNMTEYARRYTNLVPFKTISLYIKWILDENRNNNTVPIVNLTGNLILLFPLGFIFPELFSKLKNFFLYILACTGLLAVIEFVQLLTRRGSFDIDDFILNILGAVIGFVLFFFIKKALAVNEKDTKKKERK